MISPKERWGIHIIWTAFASPAFFFFGTYLSNLSFDLSKKTRFTLIPEVLGQVSKISFVPGEKACEWLGGMQGSIPDIGLVVICEFVCNWALLFTCMAMIELLLNRKRRQA